MSVNTVVLGGRYRLDGLIGRGGMASVWRAYDVELERTVAVKRLHARLLDDPELAERFRREGQAVARLNHPNLVRLLDQGQDGDESFLVFELIEGRDLKTIMRSDGRRPVAQAVSICAQVARALAAAHDAGIVHRDIKSHNVIVTDDGVAKLTDFGIARIMESEGANLTKTGIVMGSSDYLAPEQAEGKSVDHRADIYSLGVVLFEMLAGKLPFSGDNPVAVATKHVYEEPPHPKKLAPEVPRHVSAACLRALAKRPAHRFATAAAFADALERQAGDTAMLTSVPEEPTGRLRPVGRSRRKGLVAATAVVLAAAAGVGAWQVGLFDGDGGGSVEASRPVGIASVDDYDPRGDGGERGDLVNNLTDGNPESAWQTEGYKTATFAELKNGVGLQLTLDTPARVSGVRLRTTSTGGQLEIHGPGGVDGPLLGSGTLSDGAVIPVITQEPVAEITIWFTSLPQSVEDDKFRASIGEVAVLGAANS